MFDQSFGPGVSGAGVYDQWNGTVGRRPSLAHFYIQVGSPWNSWSTWGKPGVDQARNAGLTPLVTLEFWGQDYPNGIPLGDISAGKWDSWLVQWAQGVKSEPSVILLRPFHEANLGGYPWADTNGKNSPAALTSAWRHVVDVFRGQGVTNVRWVYNPGGDLLNNPIPTGEYPGDNYVDYIGSDSYGGGSGHIGTDVEYLRTHISGTKPLLMGEIGGDATWVTNELGPTMRKYPGTYVWWNENPVKIGSATASALASALAGLP